MDNASSYYFLGRRADRELTSREIVSCYPGGPADRTRTAVHGHTRLTHGSWAVGLFQASIIN
jgi:hypothetical protein